MPNAKKDWTAIVIITLQSAILGIGGWTLWSVHRHEARIMALEEWRGGERAYTPSDAKDDMRRLANEIENSNSVLKGHDRRIRELELMLARMKQ